MALRSTGSLVDCRCECWRFERFTSSPAVESKEVEEKEKDRRWELVEMGEEKKEAVVVVVVVGKRVCVWESRSSAARMRPDGQQGEQIGVTATLRRPAPFCRTRTR